jgi:hypothetical protein
LKKLKNLNEQVIDQGKQILKLHKRVNELEIALVDEKEKHTLVNIFQEKIDRFKLFAKTIRSKFKLKKENVLKSERLR